MIILGFWIGVGSCWKLIYLDITAAFIAIDGVKPVEPEVVGIRDISVGGS